MIGSYYRGVRNGTLVERRAERHESRGSRGWDRTFLFCLFPSFSSLHIFHWQGGQHTAPGVLLHSITTEEKERKFH